MKKIRSIRNVAAALAIGGVTYGTVKSCEKVENERINTEFKAEFSDADTVLADAEHNRFYAEKKGDLQKVNELEKKIKTLRVSLNKLQHSDDMAFLEACKSGKKEDVERVLQRANMNVTDKDGNTGLMLALKYNNSLSAQAIASLLLKQYGIDVFHKDKDGVDIRDLVGQKMLESATWSMVKKDVMKVYARGKGNIITYSEEKSFLYGSSEKKAALNKLEHLEKEFYKEVELRQGYTFIVNEKNIEVERGYECAAVFEDALNYSNEVQEMKENLLKNSKKRKKKEEVKRIDENWLPKELDML